MKNKALIRIVDNDAEHCEAIKFLLSTDGWEVETYTSAAEFLESKNWATPGCLILDYRMPDINGIELQEILIKQGCELPILFLTAHADVDMAISVFKKGAADLLRKPVDADQLFTAVENAVAKDAKRRASSGEKSKLDTYNQLSPREKQVLDFVSMGLMNYQIARRLNLSERTIQVHRANAYRRLGVTSVEELKELLSGK